jgi:DNA-binding MarR family transcriptional regulator
MTNQQATTYLLQHVADMLHRQLDQALQERLGIGVAQFRLLLMLQASPYIRQRQLAEYLGQTEASISRQIKLLQQRGMITVRINPNSKREHLTVPTSKGVKLTEAAQEVIAQYTSPMFAGSNDKQQKQALEALVRFHTFTCSPGKLTACNHPFNV